MTCYISLLFLFVSLYRPRCYTLCIYFFDFVCFDPEERTSGRRPARNVSVTVEKWGHTILWVQQTDLIYLISSSLLSIRPFQLWLWWKLRTLTAELSFPWTYVTPSATAIFPVQTLISAPAGDFCAFGQNELKEGAFLESHFYHFTIKAENSGSEWWNNPRLFCGNKMENRYEQTIQRLTTYSTHVGNGGFRNCVRLQWEGKHFCSSSHPPPCGA